MESDDLREDKFSTFGTDFLSSEDCTLSKLELTQLDLSDRFVS